MHNSQITAVCQPGDVIDGLHDLWVRLRADEVDEEAEAEKLREQGVRLVQVLHFSKVCASVLQVQRSASLS